MSKGIILTPSQLRACENGATLFIFHSKHTRDEILSFVDNDYIECYCPIQKGDKDIFVQEEFRIPYEYRVLYKADGWRCLTGEHFINWQPASQMTYEQSRFKFKECVGGRAVRVQDLIADDEIWYKCMGSYSLEDFINFYNQQLKEQGINRTHDDNDYIFLCELR